MVSVSCPAVTTAPSPSCCVFSSVAIASPLQRDVGFVHSRRVLRAVGVHPRTLPFCESSHELAVEGVDSERKSGALALFAGLDRRYDLLSALLSLGQDPRWRRTMVAAVEARPDDHVLDVATGTGMVARALVEDRKSVV